MPSGNEEHLTNREDLYKACLDRRFQVSNLRLAAREARGNPVLPYFAAQRAAELIGKKSESLILVGADGLEPSTSSLSVKCSSQLSYAPALNVRSNITN